MTKRHTTEHVETSSYVHAEGMEDGSVYLWTGTHNSAEPVGRKVALSPREAEALYFLGNTQKDLDLGRWRSELYPDYVVYPGKDDNECVVLNENNGVSVRFARNQYRDLHGKNKFDWAAEFYFRAHPPTGPWVNAAHGEIWELTFTDKDRDAFTMDRSEPTAHPSGVWRNMHTYLGGDSDSIKSGRKIYPEGE